MQNVYVDMSQLDLRMKFIHDCFTQLNSLFRLPYPPSIVPYENKDNTGAIATYNSGKNQMLINVIPLCSNLMTPEMLHFQMLHEYRHYIQNIILCGIWKSPFKCDEILPEIDKHPYIEGEVDYEGYLCQLVELDANAFAEAYLDCAKSQKRYSIRDTYSKIGKLDLLLSRENEIATQYFAKKGE